MSEQNVSSAADTLLRVEHLTMRFGGLLAIDDLSFDVGRGAITALIGPNGAGKTTVFNCITGFYKPSTGRLALRHGDGAVWNALAALTSPAPEALRRRTARFIYWSACRIIWWRSVHASPAPSRTSGCFPA